MTATSAAAAAEAVRIRAQVLEMGARGERVTERLLAPLRAKGYTVLTNAVIPGGHITIDHIVIGPSGVAVVESRLWRVAETVRQVEGKLFVGDAYQGEDVDRLWWLQSRLAREAKLEQLTDVAICGLLCIHGANLERDMLQLDGATAVAPAALVHALLRPKASLHPDRVAQVADAVMKVFRPTGGGPWRPRRTALPAA
jgi:hypothetical protein